MIVSGFAIGLPQARAAGFSVNPIHLELNPSQSATSLTVANYNSDPLFLQVRVYRWEHNGHEDVLTEAGNDGPLVTPPLFRLAPGGGSQVIRIGFQKTGAPALLEHQWRVIVEEVPKAAASPPESDTEPGAGLSVAVHVRVSLPLLQRPLVVHQELEWTVERSAPAAVSLIAQNLGTVTERLDGVHLGSNDNPDASVPGPVYIFPGERRTFELHPNVVMPAGNIRLNLLGTPRPLSRELVLSAQ